MTTIQTWWQWTITHDEYKDRFEATKTVDGKKITKHSESLKSLKGACDKYDNDEQIQAEKFKPIAVYKYESNWQKKFIYGKITSIYRDDWSNTMARFKGTNADTWKAESIYSTTFILQTPENEAKIEQVNSINQQIDELEKQRTDILDTMEYFIPPKI